MHKAQYNNKEKQLYLNDKNIKIAKNGWLTDVSEKKELIAYCINKDKVMINVINEQQQENNSDCIVCHTICSVFA